VGPDGRPLLKSELAYRDLAGFFQRRGVASRPEYRREFQGRYSERVLDPVRRLLVAEGRLVPVDVRRGFAHIWRWNQVP
jgi:hypothetical protein